MKQSLANVSMILFGLSVVLLILWTIFESSFAGMSPFAERIATVSLLVLPAGIGAVIGLMSLMYREGQKWLASTRMVLNTLFALFHLLLVLFAG